MPYIEKDLGWDHWWFKGKMHTVLHNIPNIKRNPLGYIFEILKIRNDKDSMWLEFGVYTGKTINYISQFTPYTVHGFDSWEGLPEDWRTEDGINGYPKGKFGDVEMPEVSKNVKLYKGWFSDTLPKFVEKHKKNLKVSFIHMDADLYSSTKCVFDNLKDYIEPGCVILFDELVNYGGFDNEKGELRAFVEYISENNVEWEWIGMNGEIGMWGFDLNLDGDNSVAGCNQGNLISHEQAAIRILSINKKI
tara:strand:- start:80 stop:823 length:744 start_codon:yes stop_codon:yes gene_type:complete